MSVVKKDPELIVYVLLSGLLTMAVAIGMAIPEIMEMSWASSENGNMSPAYMIFTFVGYMTISIIVVFWNSAIVANSHIRLNGGDPKFRDGFGVAFKKIHIIIVWGIIAGTVGLLLKMLKQAAQKEEGGAAVLAMILQAIGAAVWWMMTFFMIPHMVIEGKSIGESLKSSKDMFFKQWGENVTAGLGIGLITFLFAIPIILIAVVLMVVMGPMWWVGIIVGGVLMGLLIMWSSAAEQVAISALYIYAKTGQMPNLYKEHGMADFNLPTSA